MRTLKEVIAILAKGIADVEAYDAVDDALYYLREYHDNYGNLIASMNHHLRKIKELEQNDPLSWEELCEMEGEPIWIKTDPNPARWGIIAEVVDTDNCKLMHVLSVDEDKYPIHIYCPKDSINPWEAYQKEK